MSYKCWLLFGSLAVAGAAQSVACSSKFNTCEAKRTCAPGGASGMAGAAGATTDGEEAGADQGGSAGLEAQAGEAGTAGDDGSAAGTAGDSGLEAELAIATPTLAAGKTYVPFAGKLSASGGTAHYTWTLTGGTLPAGLSLQDAQSATVTIGGAHLRSRRLHRPKRHQLAARVALDRVSSHGRGGGSIVRGSGRGRWHSWQRDLDQRSERQWSELLPARAQPLR